MSVAIWTSILGVALGALITWIIGHIQQGTFWQRLRNVIMDRHHVCLNEEFLLSQMLAEEIKKDRFMPEVIFAISPGGGMIAEWLSRVQLGKFNEPIRVRSICVHSQRSRIGIATERPIISDDIDIIAADLPKNSKILLVTDISRGGESLRIAHEALQKYFVVKNIKTATLFYHVHSRTKPNFFAIRTEKTVYFDWKGQELT